MSRVLLIHGTATRPAVWGPVMAHLSLAASAPARPRTGNLAAELAWLAEIADDAWVAGFSGGATLALGLAAIDNGARGIIAHEPAAGTLVPGLLDAPAQALARGGVDAFGRELYGQLWQRPLDCDLDDVSSELAMFRSFEPGPPRRADQPVLVTTGARSSALRHMVADRLHASFGYAITTVPDCGHLVAQENPAAFAAMISATAAGFPTNSMGA